MASTLRLLSSSGEKKVKILKAHRTKPLVLASQLETSVIEVFDYEKLTCICRFPPLSSYTQVYQLHWVDRSTLSSVNVRVSGGFGWVGDGWVGSGGVLEG
jgi:hypothetical protein